MLLICNGMIRSGSAFQYNLVCSVIEKTGICIRHGRREPDNLGAMPTSKLKKWANDKEEYHVLKSGRFPDEFELVRQGLAKMFYINRDLRDVAVAAKFKWEIAGDELLKMLDFGLSGHKLMEEMGAFEMPWCLCQKYEEVFTNTFGAVEEIADFLGISLSIEVIEEVIEDCSMDVMFESSQSKSLGLTHWSLNFLGRVANRVKRLLPSGLNDSWGLARYYRPLLPKVHRHTLMAPNHIEPTKGAPGAWMQELDELEKTVITERYQKYLEKEGYSVSIV